MNQDLQELNLMILLHLQRQNLVDAAASLEAELAQQNLVPKRVDFDGNYHKMPISHAVRRSVCLLTKGKRLKKCNSTKRPWSTRLSD